MAISTVTPPGTRATNVPAVGLEDLGRHSGRAARRRLPRELRGALGPLLLLVAWAGLTLTGLIGSDVLPNPLEVVRTGWQLTVAGTLHPHLLASLARAAAGLAIGVTIGLSLALVAGLVRPLEDGLDSTMQVLKAIPNFALLPLLIIWLGIDEAPKITLVVLSTSMPIYINSYSAIRGVDGRLLDLARVLRLSRASTITTIVLPSALPAFLTGLRMAVTSAWLALIFAETINAPEGLGRLMTDARNWFRLDVMVLVICLYAILGLLGYAVVQLLERWLLSWRATQAQG